MLFCCIYNHKIKTNIYSIHVLFLKMLGKYNQNPKSSLQQDFGEESNGMNMSHKCDVNWGQLLRIFSQKAIVTISPEQTDLPTSNHFFSSSLWYNLTLVTGFCQSTFTSQLITRWRVSILLMNLSHQKQNKTYHSAFPTSQLALTPFSYLKGFYLHQSGLD